MSSEKVLQRLAQVVTFDFAPGALARRLALDHGR